jgi:hypothetical protein
MNISSISLSKTKDTALVGTKFLGTTAADALIFGGLPITSGLMTAYDMFARYLKKRI